MDKKTENMEFCDLMAAENPHCVDYFTWIDIVAWTILAHGKVNTCPTIYHAARTI